MNYIKQLNAFYDWRLLNTLSGKEQIVYLTILHLNNKCHWKIEFTINNPTLEALCSIDRSALNKIRNSLKQKGLIEYTNGKKGVSGKYKVIELYNEISSNNYTDNYTKTDTDIDTNTYTKKTTNVTTSNKQYKTKQNESNNIVLLNQPKKSKQSQQVFDKWINLKAGINHKTLNKDMASAIDTKIKKYGVDKILECIERLAVAVNDTSYYYNYQWNLKNFMQQKNGLANWLNEGQLWTAYQVRGQKNEGNTGHTGSDKDPYKAINWNNF